MLHKYLLNIINNQDLNALFQPIAHLQSGEIFGYEGLIRAHSDNPLHSPIDLFNVARSVNLSMEIEHVCSKVILREFANKKLPGKLFLNVSPESLLLPKDHENEVLSYIEQCGLHPDQIIIELTESRPEYNYDLLSKAVAHYSSKGFQFAIDDLGEGFSSLRLWSELRPAFVKIDMHFIQGINLDNVKLQFVRSIQQIAESSGTTVIAEGIETQTELLLIRDLGIGCGQGYHLGRPLSDPPTTLSAEVKKALNYRGVTIPPQTKNITQHKETALRLLRVIPSVTPHMTNNDVFKLFMRSPTLEVIPVVDHGKPLGLITRRSLFDRFAVQYIRELHGKKLCTMFMDPSPLITDKNTKIQDLSRSVVEAEQHHLFNGFIITDQGHYLGMGTGHDLMREITNMQINAARYANPLTLLPGNVPINEHIERLITNGAQFVACYVDLDFFKPFNDVYGYRKGDDIIQLTATILVNSCDPSRDFIGHIGGDDFLILLQSEDWEARLNTILSAFSQNILMQFKQEDVDRGGYYSEDRRGEMVFHPLISISLGAVKAEPGYYTSHHQIAAAASEAKKMSKKIHGNSLFVNRRSKPSSIENSDGTIPNATSTMAASNTTFDANATIRTTSAGSSDKK